MTDADRAALATRAKALAAHCDHEADVTQRSIDSMSHSKHPEIVNGLPTLRERVERKRLASLALRLAVIVADPSAEAIEQFGLRLDYVKVSGAAFVTHNSIHAALLNLLASAEAGGE